LYLFIILQKANSPPNEPTTDTCLRLISTNRYADSQVACYLFGVQRYGKKVRVANKSQENDTQRFVNNELRR